MLSAASPAHVGEGAAVKTSDSRRRVSMRASKLCPPRQGRSLSRAISAFLSEDWNVGSGTNVMVTPARFERATLRLGI